MTEPIGLIAGYGQLPLMVARGIREAGREVACVGLADQYEEELPPLCDLFAPAGMIRLGRWIKLLRKWGVSETVMVGGVRKVKMYDPYVAVRQMPDWRAAKLWYHVLRHDRRSASILTALADELKQGGITLIDSTRYIPEHMAGVGVLTRHQPSAAEQGDIDFALPIIHGLNELDVGQSIAVKDRDVIAVEAIEGTDRMIERAGGLCRKGGWTLVKTAKRDQDMRFDVPTVGPQTIENLKKHGGRCVAVEAGRVILVDKEQLLAQADAAGIAVVGITLDRDGEREDQS